MKQINDESTSIQDLKNEVKDFVEKRKWQKFHNPKNLACSICIEASELMEHFQWLSFEETETKIIDPKQLEMISEELADVMIYCLSFSNNLNIDISKAILRKIEKNNKKYPLGIEFDPTNKK